MAKKEAKEIALVTAAAARRRLHHGSRSPLPDFGAGVGGDGSWHGAHCPAHASTCAACEERTGGREGRKGWREMGRG